MASFTGLVFSEKNSTFFGHKFAVYIFMPVVFDIHIFLMFIFGFAITSVEIVLN